MCAQILPPKTNLGTDIGRAMGQGFQNTFEPAMQQQYQRGQLQKALGQAKDVANKPGATALDTAFALMEAGAGIPGSEKYLATLLPMLMGNQRTNQIFPQNGENKSTNGNVSNPIINDVGTKNNSFQGTPASQLTSGLPQVQEQTGTGVLPHIPTAAETQSEIENAVRASNDPATAPQWQAFYANKQKLATDQNNAMREYAAQQGIDSKEMPEFMQIGQRYGSMSNREDWARATKRDFDSYKNNKTQLDNAFIPGFFTGLTKGEKPREQALKNLGGPVKNLINLGFEQDVRKKLANEYLSPTEIESVIHPLPKDFNSTLKGLPPAPFFEENVLTAPFDLKAIQEGRTGRGIKTYDQVLKENPKIINQMNSNLSKFIKNNLNDDMSLSVLRHKLVKDKGYDWRQFGPALDRAVADGLKLTEAQQAELTEVKTQAPRDSLSEIFTDWPRVIQYFRGNK